MDSIVLEILRAYHSNRWDLVAMRSFVLIDLMPEMISMLNIASTALNRSQHRKDELARLAASLKRLNAVLGEDALGFLREPRPQRDQILTAPEGDRLGRLSVDWPGARRQRVS